MCLICNKVSCHKHIALQQFCNQKFLAMAGGVADCVSPRIGHASRHSQKFLGYRNAEMLRYWHQRADDRQGNPPHLGNQELLVVRDKV